MNVCFVICMEKSVIAVIESVGTLNGSRVLKSLNSIKKILPMVVTFNGDPRTTIMTCDSPTNASDKTDFDVFYNELSSFVYSILKHNVLTLGGDMNAQIAKKLNNKFSLHNSSNKNGDTSTDFTLENESTYLNTKFQKRKGKL